MAIDLSDNDLLNPEVISTIISETKKSEEIERRKYSFNSYQIYSGNLDPYVRKELSVIRPKSFKGYTLSDISISGMITDKRAQAYDEKPIRSVNGDEDKSEDLKDIYDEGNAEEELEFFDKIYNLNRYALMWVNNIEDDYYFQAMHPYEATVVKNKDTNELLIVGLNYPDSTITTDAKGSSSGGTAINGDGVSDLIAESQADSSANSEIWVFWTKDQHVKVRISSKRQYVGGKAVLKYDIDYIPIPGNPNGVNPLGVLPFVYLSMDTAVDYPVPNPLTAQCIKFNVQQSETLTSKNIHGSGVQTLKYPEKLQGKLDKVTHGLMSAIELPQSNDPDDAATEFEYLTSGSQLNPMQDIDMSYMEQIAKQHGLENFKMEPSSGDVQNGISKAIDGASVQKVTKRNQKKYVRLEKDMFEIIKAWESFYGRNTFSEDDELQIIFPKPKIMVSDKEILENIGKMREMGLIEEWEKFIIMDPNLSEEEARDKLERIKEEKLDNAKSIMNNSFQDDELVDGEGSASVSTISGTTSSGDGSDSALMASTSVATRGERCPRGCKKV